jgi:hypothetical protein
MPVEIRGARFDDVVWVARRMRVADREEIFATRWREDPIQLAAEAIQFSTFAWVARDGDEPVAVMGAVEECPHVFKVWMFATDRWRRVAGPMTHHVNETVIPVLTHVGANRAYCHSIAGHDVAHRWLKRLGAHCESAQPGYGKNGETFYVFAWYRDDIVEDAIDENTNGRICSMQMDCIDGPTGV